MKASRSQPHLPARLQMCMHISPATYRLEDQYGRSRVFAQWLDTEDNLQVGHRELSRFWGGGVIVLVRFVLSVWFSPCCRHPSTPAP